MAVPDNRNSCEDLEWVKIGDLTEVDGCEEEISLDDLSAPELRDLVLAGRKRLADLQASSKEQAKQIKDLKELIACKEAVASGGPTDADPTSEDSMVSKTLVEQAREREELWKMAARNKISYTSFEPGDCALFLPTSSGNFIAFNRGAPFRYLSDESLSAAKVNAGGRVDYVVGHVVEIDEGIAQEGEGNNPYSLPFGTPYFVLSVMVI